MELVNQRGKKRNGNLEIFWFFSQSSLRFARFDFSVSAVYSKGAL
jgi:hypothetical protein